MGKEGGRPERRTDGKVPTACWKRSKSKEDQGERGGVVEKHLVRT